MQNHQPLSDVMNVDNNSIIPLINDNPFHYKYYAQQILDALKIVKIPNKCAYQFDVFISPNCIIRRNAFTESITIPVSNLTTIQYVKNIRRVNPHQITAVVLQLTNSLVFEDKNHYQNDIFILNMMAAPYTQDIMCGYVNSYRTRTETTEVGFNSCQSIGDDLKTTQSGMLTLSFRVSDSKIDIYYTYGFGNGKYHGKLFEHNLLTKLSPFFVTGFQSIMDISNMFMESVLCKNLENIVNDINEHHSEIVQLDLNSIIDCFIQYNIDSSYFQGNVNGEKLKFMNLLKMHCKIKANYARKMFDQLHKCLEKNQNVKENVGCNDYFRVLDDIFLCAAKCYESSYMNEESLPSALETIKEDIEDASNSIIYQQLEKNNIDITFLREIDNQKYIENFEDCIGSAQNNYNDQNTALLPKSDNDDAPMAFAYDLSFTDRKEVENNYNAIDDGNIALQKHLMIIDKGVEELYKRHGFDYNHEFMKYVKKEDLNNPETIKEEIGCFSNDLNDFDPGDCAYSWFIKYYKFPIPSNCINTVRKDAYCFYIIKYCHQFHRAPSDKHIKEHIITNPKVAITNTPVFTPNNKWKLVKLSTIAEESAITRKSQTKFIPKYPLRAHLNIFTSKELTKEFENDYNVIDDETSDNDSIPKDVFYQSKIDVYPFEDHLSMHHIHIITILVNFYLRRFCSDHINYDYIVNYVQFYLFGEEGIMHRIVSNDHDDSVTCYDDPIADIDNGERLTARSNYAITYFNTISKNKRDFLMAMKTYYKAPYGKIIKTFEELETNESHYNVIL